MLALLGGTPVRNHQGPPWPVHGATERELLLRVLESSDWSYDGPMEADFCRSFAEFCGVSHAFCVTNGTQALEIALRALGVGPGDEVLVPALTWTAPPWAVVRCGAVPVFVDIGRDDWCIDPGRLEESVTPATRAVIPVHMFNQIADMDAISRVAAAHSLAVLEDCAHVHGAQWRERSVGAYGHVGIFSFQQGKPMTCGEGGALVTDDDVLADRIYGLKNCGRRWHADSGLLFSGNHRITEFQAAVLIGQLERLLHQLHTKQKNLAEFRRSISAVPGVRPLDRKECVTREGMFAVPLRMDRDRFAGAAPRTVVAALVAEGVPARLNNEVVYRSPLWRSGLDGMPGRDARAAWHALGLDAHCPVAEQVEREGLLLAHQAFLGDSRDVEEIVAAFAKVQRHAKELPRAWADDDRSREA